MAELGDVDRARSVEAKAGLGRENAPDGSVDALFGDAARIDGGFEARERSGRRGRHEQHVDASAHGAHGDFAGRVKRGDAAHIERVRNDQAGKFHLVAQQAGEDRARKRGGRAPGRFKRGHREVAWHD
jgi:hypothetical protein